ncbi:MAG: endonuclease III [Ignavibacteriales bacterium]|nr:endonuclease III [Ignavibacteriales bacterium]
MEKLLKSINQKLLNHFGKPPRAEKLPQPIDLLIATILSQNTNDRNSYKAYQNLIGRFKTWEEVNKAKRISVEKEIKVAGLGLQKSTAIKNLLNQLYEKVGSFSLDNILEMNNIETIDYLTSFKGIGVKTASCVLLFSLDKNICPVDTHVHRTMNRIGVVQTKNPDKTFSQINENLPSGIAHSLHTNLIRLGREYCTPKNYKCKNCPVVKICKHTPKNLESKNKNNDRPFMLLDSV